MRAAVALLAFISFAAPLRAEPQAVTIDQVIALSQAGVAEEVIVALIDRDKPVFSIDPARLIELKRAGVSETLVMAMLRSGRMPWPPAPLPPTIGPDVVIVGHGPDSPNIGQDYAPALFGAPLFWLPSPVPCVGLPALAAGHAPPVQGFGRFMSDPSARFMNNGFISNGSPRPAVDCHQRRPHPRRSR
jgi:hypothetical protein